MRFDYTEGRDSSEIIIEEVNVDEFIKILNDTRLLKYGDDSSNEKLKNDVEYFKLKYEKSLEQIAELEESSEELQACYGEIEKLNDEINEWKQKYENECKHNDVIKKSYDRLAKSFEDLVKQLNDAKYLYEGTTKAYDELHKNFEDTVRELNEYKKVASDRDDLKIALDQANDYVTAVEKSRDEWIEKCETLKQASMNCMDERDSAKNKVWELERNVIYWKSRYESKDILCKRLEERLKEWQPKSES